MARRELAQSCIAPPGMEVPPPAYVTRMVRVSAKSVASDALGEGAIEHPLPAPVQAR